MKEAEFVALREEIVAKHNAAIAVFSGTLGVLAAILALTRPCAGEGAAFEVLGGLVALHILLASSALVIKALFDGTRLIAAYIQVFHEKDLADDGPLMARHEIGWETANTHYRGGRGYFSQTRAMGWSLIAIRVLLLVYGTTCLLRSPASGISIGLLAFATLVQILSAARLVRHRYRGAQDDALREWRRVYRGWHTGAG